MPNTAASAAPVRRTRLPYRGVVLDFAILLDHARTIFMPGQKVEGHLVLSLAAPCDVKLLRIRFCGIVQTQLYKSDNTLSNQNTSTVTIFKEIHTFLGSAVTGDLPEQMEAGEHRFPFAFRVPPTQLPASFEGPYGRVRYEVAAVLVRPQQINKLTSVTITIPSTVDSSDLDLLEPCSASVSGPAGFWLWKSGHLDVSVNLPKSGYASEEVVPITLEITNHSGSGAVLKEICLKQRVTYRTFKETRGPMTTRIHKLTFTEQYPHATRRVSRVINFPIPSTNMMAPSITTSILDVSHVVIVKVASKASLSKTIKVQVPIVIAGFPAMYFDNYVLRESMETLPAYECNEGSPRRGRESIMSRISREIRRGRSRSRAPSASRRRGSNHSETSAIGPEWEPTSPTQPPPPVPELPPHIRRQRSATISLAVEDRPLPVNRARGRSVSEGVATRVLPPLSEQTEETISVEHETDLLTPWPVSARRTSVVIMAPDHGIEGEFGGASSPTPTIVVSPELPVADDSILPDDIILAIPPVTDLPSEGAIERESCNTDGTQTVQVIHDSKPAQIEETSPKEQGQLHPGSLSRIASNDSAVVLKRD